MIELMDFIQALGYVLLTVIVFPFFIIIGVYSCFAAMFIFVWLIELIEKAQIYLKDKQND